ncbi:MAG: serine hydrolase [Acidimicrobiales bacterium]
MSRFRRAPLLVAFALGALAVGCSDDDATSEPAASTATSAPAATSGDTTAVPDTTAAPETTAAPSTEAPTTPAPTTTLASPTGDVFPGDDWAVGEFPADVDRAALDAAVDVAFGAPDATARVRSIVVVKGGEIVYERYHPLDGPDTIMDSYSVAKSYTSAVIGMLIGDGKLSLDGPAPVALWSDPADPRHEITIEQLLHMASGLDWTEAYGDGSQVLQMFGAERASDVPASAPLEAQPGEKFEYSTGTTAILAGIAIDTLGGPEAFDEYVHERLFDPIGVTSLEFTTDRSGRWFGGFGANQTTRDFARFGLLYLNDGIWEGQRLIPEGWVEYSHTPSATNEQYGAQWWMFRTGAFEARGLFGQVILVSPEHDLVMALNTTQGGDVDTLVSTAYALFTNG